MLESRADGANGSKRVTAEDGKEFLPGQRAKAIAAVKPLSPTRPDLVEKPCQRSGVPRYAAVVRVVSAQLLVELLVLFINRQMPVVPAPTVDVPNRSAEAVSGGLEFDNPVSIPGTGPVMGEA